MQLSGRAKGWPTAAARSVLGGAAGAARSVPWPRVFGEAAKVGIWLYALILLSVFGFVSAFSMLGLGEPGEALLEVWVGFVGTLGVWMAFGALVASAARRVVHSAGDRPKVNGAVVGVLSALAAWGATNYRYGNPEAWELFVFVALGLVAGPRGGVWGGEAHAREEAVLRAGDDIGLARSTQEIAEAVGVHLRASGATATAVWLARAGEIGSPLGASGPVLELGGAWASDGDLRHLLRRTLEPRRAPELASALEATGPDAETTARVVDPGDVPVGSWPVGDRAPSGVLVVPLRHPDAPPDLLLVALRSRRLAGLKRRLSRPDMRRYLQVAAHVATRLEALRLLEEGRDEGGTAERERMQHELHDSIIQGLIGCKFVLDEARGPGAEAAALRASGIIEELRAEVRRVVKALKTPALKNGLGPALDGIARSLERDPGIPAAAEVAGDVRELPHRLEAAVYWLAHEAAQNIRKHAAGARRAKLTLTYLPEAVALDVRDDGQGFDPSAARAAGDPLHSGGTGISAWTESVERMGGTLNVRSAPGSGTTLTATIPTGPALSRVASDRAGP